MNDENDTPPEGVTPMPVASPRHPSPPRRSTTKELALDAILQTAKKQKARRPLNYTLIGVVVTALTTGVVTGMKKSKESTEQRLERLEGKVRHLQRRHEWMKRSIPFPVAEPPEEKEDSP